MKNAVLGRVTSINARKIIEAHHNGTLLDYVTVTDDHKLVTIVNGVQVPVYINEICNGDILDTSFGPIKFSHRLK